MPSSSRKHRKRSRSRERDDESSSSKKKRPSGGIENRSSRKKEKKEKKAKKERKDKRGGGGGRHSPSSSSSSHSSRQHRQETKGAAAGGGGAAVSLAYSLAPLPTQRSSDDPTRTLKAVADAVDRLCALFFEARPKEGRLPANRKAAQGYLTNLLCRLDGVEGQSGEGGVLVRSARRKLVHRIDSVSARLDRVEEDNSSEAGKEEGGGRGNGRGREEEEVVEGPAPPPPREFSSPPTPSSPPPAAPASSRVRRSNMVPMRLEEYHETEEYEASRRVTRQFDPLSGRTRLVRGSGEILEEIVSRDQQRAINRTATHTDGVMFGRGLARAAGNRR